MSYQNIQIEVVSPIATITINRPKRLNALNALLVEELDAALHALADDDNVRVIILTGAGDKAFVAGADISEMAGKTVAQARAFAERGQRVLAYMEDMDKPIIAAVNGYALGGGCELAMACDFILASDNALLGQPEVNLGIIPGFGGTQRLARRVPLGLARELVQSGRNMNAAEALRIGLVNAVHPQAELLAEARKVAGLIAQKGPLAVAAAKRLMTVGPDLPLAAANELECRTFAALFASDDQKEGMTAFLEKRKAAFKGK